MASLRPTAKSLLLAGLLAAGLIAWYGPGFADIGRSGQVVALLAALALACIPPINRSLDGQFDRLRQAPPAWRCWLPLIAGAACSIYLFADAVHQSRSFVSLWHDDCCYEIQARMLAQGRLWMPLHPAADSFDSHYLFVRPVYAPLYFPGTALLLAPLILLHLPVVVAPILIAGAVGGIVCELATELIDPLAGLIAPLLWVSSSQVRIVSLSAASILPMTLMGLLALWAFLRFQQRAAERFRWSIILGALAGWAAITRPLDCVCLIGPIALAAAWRTSREEPPMRAARLAAAALLSALPFFLVEGIQNRGITGSWFQTPHELYHTTQFPNATFGFHRYDPSAEPSTPILQKRVMYDEFMRPALRIHTWDNQWSVFWLLRLPAFLQRLAPHPLIVIFISAGAAGVVNAPRLFATLPFLLHFVAMVFLPYFLDYYPVVVWPAACILILLGMERSGDLLPPFARPIRTAATMLVLALALGALPEFDPGMHDGADEKNLMNISRQLDSLKNKPAIVLFRYTPEVTFFEEPVYNTDVAWPDDAPVVRAHDLTPALNAKLFRYYARNQPQRWVYLYDRPSGSLRLLGKVTDLAALVR